MITLLFGPPGSGKGTQATGLSKQLAVPHVATGDIFRKNLKENTALGQLAKGYMDKGLLVPDDVTCRMVADRLSWPDAAGGVLFDGFPRSVPQAEWLLSWMDQAGVVGGTALLLDVPEAEVLTRIAGRRSCRACSAPYHVVYDPPGLVCRNCGGAEIVQRSDDQESVVLERLEKYRSETFPALSVLKRRMRVQEIAGVGPISEIRARLQLALGL